MADAFVQPTLNVRSFRALQRNFGRLPKHIADSLPRDVRRHGNETFGRAQAESPWKTGRMSKAHRLRFSDQELAYEVFVAQSPFQNDGVAYYPPFVHDGTSRQAANPWLRRVYDEQERTFQKEINKGAQRSLRNFRPSV